MKLFTQRGEGPWRAVTAKRTNSSGWVRFDHKIIKTPCTEYKLVFPGDGSYAPRSVFVSGYCPIS